MQRVFGFDRKLVKIGFLRMPPMKQNQRWNFWVWKLDEDVVQNSFWFLVWQFSQRLRSRPGKAILLQSSFWKNLFVQSQVSSNNWTYFFNVLTDSIENERKICLKLLKSQGISSNWSFRLFSGLCCHNPDQSPDHQGHESDDQRNQTVDLLFNPAQCG